MPRRAAPLLALAVALALAGCGQSNPQLIPAGQADALLAEVVHIQDACAQGDQRGVEDAIGNARTLVYQLPNRTDRRLSNNIRKWLRRIADRAPVDCSGPEATPTPTATATETPTPTPTATPTATPTPTPTPTATPATPTPTPTPTAPPVSGGVPAPETPTP